MLSRDSEILEKLRRKGSRVLSFRDLVKRLHVRERDEDAFREGLDALERRGEIVRVRGEKYSALEFTNQVAGRITVRPEGFGGHRTASTFRRYDVTAREDNREDMAKATEYRRSGSLTKNGRTQTKKRNC